MKILEKIEEEVRSWNIPRFVQLTLLLIIVFFLSTGIHESAHLIVAYLIGCNAGIGEVKLLTGETGVDCPNDWQYGITALAGPLVSFAVGFYLWFSEVKPMEMGELSEFRMFAVILFFLSAIFQLFPGLIYSDGWHAISFGIPPGIVWGLWFLIVGLTANIIISEPIRRTS